MSDTLEKAEQTIREIKALGEKRRQESRALFEEKSKGEKRRPPPDFVPSSFLVLRSFAGDRGVRPLPSTMPFWISPALRVLATGGGSAGDIVAGSRYEIECEINNRGDLPVPSAKAEFFLSDPTIGFDTRWATPLGVAATYVPGLGTARLRIPFTPSGAQGGHKCLIARTFSVMPADLPIDETNLSPVLDRRIAQLNIHIVNAGTPYGFNLVTQANVEGMLHVRGATLRELAALGLPLLTEHEFVDGARFAAEVGHAGIKQVSGATELGIRGGKGGVMLIGEGKGPTLADQKR